MKRRPLLFGVVCTLGLMIVVLAWWPNPSTAALEYAVLDMLELAPEEARSFDRFISAEFEGTEEVMLPRSVVQASELLSIDSVRFRERQDQSSLVLNLFPSRMEGDSIRVFAEWLVFLPGRTWWGTEYEYHLRCLRKCEIIRRSGPGFLN